MPPWAVDERSSREDPSLRRDGKTITRSSMKLGITEETKISMCVEGPNIEYPYLPEGKKLKYVAHDHPFMLEAKMARETLSGDPVYPVGAVAVRDGQVLVRAGNGYNLGAHNVHICPRIVHESPSGQGYDLCTFHVPEGHAEQMTVKAAQEQGIDLTGADLYMYGHWWACESCWNKVLAAGIKDIYVTVDAHERFHRDVIHKAVCMPSIKSVYIAGAISGLSDEEHEESLELYRKLDASVRGLGLECFVPHLHSQIEQSDADDVKEVFDEGEKEIAARDAFVAEVSVPSHGVGMELMNAYKLGKPIVLLSKKGSTVGRFVRGIPSVVYHTQYENADEAAKFLKNILMQL